MKYVVHILHYFNKWFRLEQYATHFWACSMMAGEFMFPKRVHSRITQIPNAVDTDRFHPDDAARVRIRAELNIPKDALVIGHVARMCHVKNQSYLLQVVGEAVKRDPSVRLLFVGDGELRQTLEEEIARRHLEPYVILTGARTDVPALLCAMDVFVLTSFSEGLSVSAVEAQACGLNCVVPTTVSPETDLCGNMRFLPLDAGAGNWADVILEAASAQPIGIAEKLKEGGYSLSSAAEKLYRRFLKREESVEV